MLFFTPACESSKNIDVSDDSVNYQQDNDKNVSDELFVKNLNDFELNEYILEL